MKCPTSLIHVRQDQKRHYAKYSMKNINRIVKVNIQPVTYQLLLVGEKIEFILPINRSNFFHKKNFVYETFFNVSYGQNYTKKNFLPQIISKVWANKYTLREDSLLSLVSFPLILLFLLGLSFCHPLPI